MHKILIEDNLLKDYEDDFIFIGEKKIVFKKSGDYVLEYLHSEQVELEIVVMEYCLVKLFISSVDNDLKVVNHYVLGEESQLLLCQFYCNQNVFEKTIVDLNGKKSFFRLGFSSISKGIEEYDIIVNHNASFAMSDISNKCIGLDGSRLYFQIDSNLKKGNVDCVMDQNTRILTLGDVDAKVLPNMFIEENNVTARHGSVIGSFQEEEIFYLMSRGIDYNEAVILLIKGFIFSNLLVDMEKRSMIYKCIQDLRR